MALFETILFVVQILVAITLCGLILLQHGKGADMGASFGSGASGSLFGATGSANFLSRSTAVCAAVFFVCTLALAFFSNDRARPSSGSVLDQPAAAAPAASLPATGAALVPGATGASAVLAPAAPAATASGAGAVPAK
jgi:preprotein translocase subunit SecG